jgi:hypothetical protein
VPAPAGLLHGGQKCGQSGLGLEAQEMGNTSVSRLDTCVRSSQPDSLIVWCSGVSGFTVLSFFPNCRRRPTWWTTPTRMKGMTKTMATRVPVDSKPRIRCLANTSSSLQPHVNNGRSVVARQYLGERFCSSFYHKSAHFERNQELKIGGVHI